MNYFSRELTFKFRWKTEKKEKTRYVYLLSEHICLTYALNVWCLLISHLNSRTKLDKNYVWRVKHFWTLREYNLMFMLSFHSILCQPINKLQILHIFYVMYDEINFHKTVKLLGYLQKNVKILFNLKLSLTFNWCDKNCHTTTVRPFDWSMNRKLNSLLGYCFCNKLYVLYYYD